MRRIPLTASERLEKAFARFCQYVEFAGDCWIWTGARNSPDYAYGQFRDENMKHVQAHTFSYEFFVGPLPDGLVPDHLCRNEACVNPRHVEPVTNQENILRGAHIVPCIHGQRTRSHCRVCTQEYQRTYRQTRAEHPSSRTNEHATEPSTYLGVHIANSLVAALDLCVARERTNRSRIMRQALTRYVQECRVRHGSFP